MGASTYGDACRFAHALDLVGRRWALLVVRELLLGPKRFSDLRRGLPNASSNILSERLRELEEAGVIRRRELPPPIAARVYELTEWGRELEDVVTRLGAWGARAPVPPDCRHVGTDSIVLALRSLFDPERAEGLEASCRLAIGGEAFRVDVADDSIELRREGEGEEPAPIEIEADAAPTLAAVLTGQLSVEDAEASGALTIARGGRAARRFLKLFPMPAPAPAPVA